MQNSKILQFVIHILREAIETFKLWTESLGLKQYSQIVNIIPGMIQ